MIEVNSEYTKIEGGEIRLLSELATATKAIYEGIKNGRGEEFAKEQINNAVGLALKSDEELAEEVKKVMESIKKTLSGAIASLSEEGKDETEN